MLTILRWAIVCSLCIAGSIPLAHAAVAPSPLLTAQGRLDSNGIAVNGSERFVFSILNPDTSVAWTSGPVTVSVVDGLYAVLLGNTSAGMPAIPATVLSTPGLSLQVQAGSTMLTPNVAIIPALQSSFAFAVADGSITASSLAAGAVTAPALAPGAITAPALAPGSVTDPAVTSVGWSKITGAPTTLAGFGITDAIHGGTNGPLTITSLPAPMGTPAVPTQPTGGSPGDLAVGPAGMSVDAQGDVVAVGGTLYQQNAGTWQPVVQAGNLRVVVAPQPAPATYGLTVLSSDAPGSVVAVWPGVSAATSPSPTITLPAAHTIPAGSLIHLSFSTSTMTSPGCTFVLATGDTLTYGPGIVQAASGSAALASAVLPVALTLTSDGSTHWYAVQ